MKQGPNCWVTFIATKCDTECTVSAKITTDCATKKQIIHPPDSEETAVRLLLTMLDISGGAKEPTAEPAAPLSVLFDESVPGEAIDYFWMKQLVTMFAFFVPVQSLIRSPYRCPVQAGKHYWDISQRCLFLATFVANFTLIRSMKTFHEYFRAVMISVPAVWSIYAIPQSHLFAQSAVAL